MRAIILHASIVFIATTFFSPATAGDTPATAGFTPIFNGKDLSGWVLVEKKGTAGVPLEGKAETASKRIRAADGHIVFDEKVKGDVVITTTGEFGPEAQVKFEFLPGPGCNNDLFFHGVKFDLKKSDVKNLKEGEWNTFEIIAHAGQVEFRNNGATLMSAKATSEKSPLGLRAEAGPVQYRNLVFK